MSLRSVCKRAVFLIKSKDKYLLRRFALLLRTGLWKLPFLFKKQRGVEIFTERWDHLIIIDACRYDLFQKNSWLHGTLEKRESVGSCTVEFLKKNLRTNHDDVIYITANPVFYTLFGTRRFFFKVFHLWDTHWNDQLGTVMPSTVTAFAKKIRRTYPDKRLIIHFIQPHYPFLGPSRRKFIRKFEKDILEKNIPSEQLNMLIADEFRFGSIRREEVRRAYEENTRLVLRAVEQLLPHLDGKVVITSDHGELIGEKKLWFHPSRTYLPELVEIPWFVPDLTHYKSQQDLLDGITF